MADDAPKIEKEYPGGTVNKMPSTSKKNARGEWVPAVPYPLFTFPHRHRCHCGRSYWTMDGYRGHYAVTHIIDGIGGAP